MRFDSIDPRHLLPYSPTLRSLKRAAALAAPPSFPFVIGRLNPKSPCSVATTFCRNSEDMPTPSRWACHPATVSVLAPKERQSACHRCQPVGCSPPFVFKTPKGGDRFNSVTAFVEAKIQNRKGSRPLAACFAATTFCRNSEDMPSQSMAPAAPIWAPQGPSVKAVGVNPRTRSREFSEPHSGRRVLCGRGRPKKGPRRPSRALAIRSPYPGVATPRLYHGAPTGA